jgi:hypothetical protein
VAVDDETRLLCSVVVMLMSVLAPPPPPSQPPVRRGVAQGGGRVRAGGYLVVRWTRSFKAACSRSRCACAAASKAALRRTPRPYGVSEW